MDNTSPQKITLEDITQRRKEVLLQIREQQQVMATTTHKIFAPLAPAASSTSALLRSFNTGMAIFDGVMMGVKLMRRVRNMFSR